MSVVSAITATPLTAEAAMEAAVAAAAELASQGGMELFHSATKAHTTTMCEEKEHFSVSSDSDKADNDDCSEGEEDAVARLSRSRERNREHARRTRQRKKAQLELLQVKVKGLEAESRVLRQSIEDCSIASILVGLSTNSSHPDVVGCLLDCSETKKASAKIISGKRKRFVSEDAVERVPQPLKLTIDGEVTFIGGGKTHINWKSGVYCDDVGVQRQLTQDQLESLRRERNRMHAKMTRDRKKCFIAAVERTIDELEAENQRLRDALTKMSKHVGGNAVTPNASPLMFATPEPSGRVSHGFSLAAPSYHVSRSVLPPFASRHN